MKCIKHLVSFLALNKIKLHSTSILCQAHVQCFARLDGREQEGCPHRYGWARHPLHTPPVHAVCGQEAGTVGHLEYCTQVSKSWSFTASVILGPEKGTVPPSKGKTHLWDGSFGRIPGFPGRIPHGPKTSEVCPCEAG